MVLAGRATARTTARSGLPALAVMLLAGALAVTPPAVGQQPAPADGAEAGEPEAKVLERAYRKARDRYDRVREDEAQLRAELSALERRLHHQDRQYRQLLAQAPGVLRDRRLAQVRNQQRALANDAARLRILLGGAQLSVKLAARYLLEAAPPWQNRLLERARRLSDQDRPDQAQEVFDEAMAILKETSNLERSVFVVQKIPGGDEPPRIDPDATPAELIEERKDFEELAAAAADLVVQLGPVEAMLGKRVDHLEQLVERGFEAGFEERLRDERQKLRQVKALRARAGEKATIFRAHVAELRRVQGEREP